MLIQQIMRSEEYIHNYTWLSNLQVLHQVPELILFVYGINILQHQPQHLHADAHDNFVCDIQVVKCKIWKSYLYLRQMHNF